MVTGLLTVLQQSTPDGRRGTVFAAFGVAASVGQAIGMVGGGLLGDRLGVVTVLNGQGTLYLVAAAIAAGWLTTRRPRRAPAQRAVVEDDGLTAPSDVANSTVQP
jgi:MFS family permease